MLQYPQIDPVAFQILNVKVHWYGLMYLLSLLAAWRLALWRAKLDPELWSKEAIADLIFYAAIGIVVGGRLGYVFFYDGHAWLQEPLMLFRIWEGGMSFHGGLIGVLLALKYFSYKKQCRYFIVSDFVAPLVPFGLAAGRIGNFINGELWGRMTTVPWAMVFPRADLQLRHPSQLYEFALEGILLFVILWIYSSKPRKTGATSAMFLMLYGLVRCVAEYFRQPDVALGFVLLDRFTMGQLLSLPMILCGMGLWLWSQQDKYQLKEN